MPKGKNTAHSPERIVDRSSHEARFGVGDVITTPMKGPVTVQSVGKRWFTGVTGTGSPFGETGIHIPEGEYTGKPWPIERKS